MQLYCGEVPCGKSLLANCHQRFGISCFNLTNALAQDSVDQQFGVVNFGTSCNEVAQRRFTSGNAVSTFVLV